MNILLKETEEVCFHTPQLHHVRLQEIYRTLLLYAANIHIKQQAMYVYMAMHMPT